MMSTMKTGAVTQCRTFNHLFQLWSSSSLSITGTVSARRMLAGVWREVCERERGEEGCMGGCVWVERVYTVLS